MLAISANTDIIEKAYKVADEAHNGQKRKSGEDYIIHPLSVALILADLEMDKETIMAGMLHDVVEDTEFTLDDVREIYVECGFENYFDIYIKDALERITHDKAVDYGEYIKILLTYKICQTESCKGISCFKAYFL